MTPSDSDHPARKIRSFVRREGRLTRGQQHALQLLWPRFGLETSTQLDLDKIFERSAPRTLEIGFGNGDTLLTMAADEPQTDFLGIEVHRPGVGRLLHELESRALDNVRVIREDAVPVLGNCLPDNSLDRLLLFFPDPWHKKRHHKRRIVQAEFIELLAKKIKPGGILHMATDWENYAEQMLEVTGSSTAFRNPAGAGNFSPRPGYRPTTKFELRGRRLGHGVWDILFERC
ncbi:MAG: tRNA (guanosine(46)-N7)-methyltransferase TrmB [Gammaproteobacteria bacterium]|nr:tRNA (guanosine(46)-N7)-methyltransferase TrmB [Gammaproteobacteria bacterium]